MTVLPDPLVQVANALVFRRMVAAEAAQRGSIREPRRIPSSKRQAVPSLR